MTTVIFAKQALLADGWQRDVAVTVGADGRIKEVANDSSTTDHCVDVLLPAVSNCHSHAFQRAMAGLAESKSAHSRDDFWTWRNVMYRFLDILTPEEIQAIAAQVQMEMLEAGYAASAEFHYLHHDRNGERYANIGEISERMMQAASDTGIGYTHLPVLYMRGGFNDEALSPSQKRFACSIEQYQILWDSLQHSMQSLPSDSVLGVAPHSLRAVSKEGLQAVSEIAAGKPVHIHIAEQQKEVDESLTALGARPVRWLMDNINVNQHWCLVHATHCDQQESLDMARSEAVAGLCPITEANLGDGVFSGSDYIQAQGRFAVGSDSNVKIALSEELRMLEMSQRLKEQRRIVFCDEQTQSNGRFLYQHAALGGAQSLGRQSGGIKVGLFADLVALNGQHAALVELSDDAILDAWIFASGDDIVSDVWAAGRHVVVDGKHVRRDSIHAQFLKTIKRLRSQL